MRINRALIALTLGLIFALGGLATNTLRAQPAAMLALTGKVTSVAEGAMEGVLVSAKRSDSTITVTVVTDAQGRYGFPAARLAPGDYALKIRAIGYELPAPVTATVTAQQTTTADLTLQGGADVAQQMNSAEWLMSMPGTDKQKNGLIECLGCHTLQRVMMSHYTADQLLAKLPQMFAYANMSTPLHPQRRLGPPRMNVDEVRALATFLAGVNLSTTSRWRYPLKTLPRPTGAATHVIITEYDLPRVTIEPHDVYRDSKGLIWFSDFGESLVGQLDPSTGKEREFPLPLLKGRAPTGELGFQAGSDGAYWLAMMYQGGVARFDPVTHEVKEWPVPPQWNSDATQETMVEPVHMNVDGKVWMNDVDLRVIYRLDAATGNFEKFGPLMDAHGASMGNYSIFSDSHNNLYTLDFGGGAIGRIDAKTGALGDFETPTPYSRPRRGMMDDHDNVWFAEYAADKVGKFDTKTDRFDEWPVKVPWFEPYDVALDKHGELWTGSMFADRVVRLNPKSGTEIDYLLPRDTNIRNVIVDNTGPTVTFWAGNNHDASILKLEPLP